MRTCMYVLRVHVYMCVYMRVWVYMCAYMWVCVHTCVYLWICVHMCIYVHVSMCTPEYSTVVYVYMCVSVHLSIYVGQQLVAGVFFRHSVPYFWRQRFSRNLESDNVVIPSAQQAPGIFLSLPFQFWGDEGAPPHLPFSMSATNQTEVSMLAWQTIID